MEAKGILTCNYTSQELAIIDNSSWFLRMLNDYKIYNEIFEIPVLDWSGELIEYFIEVYCIRHDSMKCGQQKLFSEYGKLLEQLVPHPDMIDFDACTWCETKWIAYMNHKFELGPDNEYLGIDIIFSQKPVLDIDDIMNQHDQQLISCYISTRCSIVHKYEDMIPFDDVYIDFKNWMQIPHITKHKFRAYMLHSSMCRERGLNYVDQVLCRIIPMRGG
jgi:hypothetical protein